MANIRLLAMPPVLPRHFQISSLPLPDGSSVASSLRDSPFASEIERLAESVVAHRFPILGIEIETGPSIEWRRDYVHSRVTGPSYFRFIPYLDFDKAGDHKVIWELSRHQHLVVLAQAYLLTGREIYLNEITNELQSWWAQNPFLRGINWASALEVAFRALSWLWLDHWIGDRLSEIRRQLWTSLYQHGCYLEHNLSTYFSPNTHLLGEGVALFALGLKFPSGRWHELGARIVHEELDRQVRPDGSHFEQSAYYHVYALDFFLFFYVVAGKPDESRIPLVRMAKFLAALIGPEGDLSVLGDDDGGRLFHPYGERGQFGRATLATANILFPGVGLPSYPDEIAVQAAWWLEPRERSRAEPAGAARSSVARSSSATELFPNSGLAVITRPDLHILIDAGPFGPGGAGHSHSDTLSLTIKHRSREILIDPGTYTYVADPKLRELFRGASAHNTIRIDQQEQADPVRPFRWDNKPAVNVRCWHSQPGLVYLDAACSYRGFTHRRRFVLAEESALFILDEITGPSGDHTLEQFWHTGEPVIVTAPNRLRIASTVLLLCAPVAPSLQESWRSRTFGQKTREPLVSVVWRASLPQFCAAAFLFHGPEPTADLRMENKDDRVTLVAPDHFAVRFGEGIPSILRP